MLKTLTFSYRLEMDMKLNSILYFLKRVSLLKGVVKNVSYEHVGLGNTLTVLAIIYRVLSKTVSSFLSIFIAIGVPLLMRVEQLSLEALQYEFWHIFVFIYLIMGGLIGSKIVEPSRKKFICVKLLRINARDYSFAEYFPALILEFIIQGIIFFFFGIIIKLDAILVIFLVAAKTVIKMFGECLHLAYYKKTGQFLHKKISVILSFGAISLAAAYLPIYADIVFELQSGVLFAIGMIGCIVGMYGLYYLSKFPLYQQAISDANLLDELSITVQSAKASANFKQVNIQADDYNKNLSVNQFDNREGYEYLNAIFFERHKRMLYRPVMIQVGVILLVGIIGVVLGITNSKFQELYGELILQRFPVFVFVLYLMSTALKATKAMFYNCDISLLRYGFYKKKRAVLTTFSLRLNKIVVSNLMPATALAAIVLFIGYVTNKKIIQLLPVALMILVLSIFFSVHNLFLYYIFQPYTTELNVKNPLFSITNFIVYLLSYACFQIEGAPKQFLTVIIAITVVYIIGALMCVYKFASKTFVVK